MSGHLVVLPARFTPARLSPSRFRTAFLAALVGAVSLASIPVTAQGTVSAATPEAARVGANILDAGGNAADAAVAVAFALAVTEPADSGLGGQAQIILQRPGEPPTVIRGCSRAPSRIPAVVKTADIRDHRATTVPCEVRVLETLWKRFGSGRIPWRQLVEPAAELAEKGFFLGAHRRASLARNTHHLRRRPTTAAVFLAADGKVPAPDQALKQPALARTLRRLAEAGAADFYTGEIARAIADDMRKHGGWITLEDLRDTPEPDIVKPIRTTYRGFEVYTLPPPSGGWVVLQALNILEHAPAAELAFDHRNRPIWMAEALRAATTFRRKHPVPDQSAYEEAVQSRVSKEQSKILFEKIVAPTSGETTHFSIVDNAGMVIGVTQSIGTFFGARVLSPGLGFLYNNYMTEFSLSIQDHPFALKPGALAYSSMAATIVTRDGRPVLVLGGPGGGRIISSVLLVLSGWIDCGQDLGRAVRAPRLYYRARDLGLRLEQYPTDPALTIELQQRRFAVSVPVTAFRIGDLDAYFGGINAVALEGSRWRGIADLRRDGAVRTSRAPVKESGRR